MVIASVSGWDGVRIVGAFSSKELAVKLCKDAGIETDSDSFYIDVVEIDKVSRNYQLVVDPSNDIKGFVKVHIYDETSVVVNDDS